MAESKLAEGEWMIVPVSGIATATINPIRQIVDKIVMPKASPEKPIIPLSIGDPAVFGNLDVPQIAVESLAEKAKVKKYHGYAPSAGWLEAREAVAQKYNTAESPVTAADVLIASGCSGALNVVIPALADQGDNILIPQPGFSLYQTICGHYRIEGRLYPLLPNKEWEVDMKALETMVDSKTRAILINNPGNPTGSNYSREHLLEILAFAEKHRLPIIADEIYADMVFSGQKFHALHTLSKEVPVLTLGGVAKQYVMPGWRVGWVVMNDRKGRLAHVRDGILSLSQLVLGANTVAQAVLPDLLHKTDAAFYSGLSKTLEDNANFFLEKLKAAPGLRPIVPQGAMYVMIEVLVDQFRDIADDTDFAQKLLQEEFVFVLPGKCFQAPNFFRVVFCAPQEILGQAAARIEAFCKAHIKPTATA